MFNSHAPTGEGSPTLEDNKSVKFATRNLSVFLYNLRSWIVEHPSSTTPSDTKFLIDRFLLLLSLYRLEQERRRRRRSIRNLVSREVLLDGWLSIQLRRSWRKSTMPTKRLRVVNFTDLFSSSVGGCSPVGGQTLFENYTRIEI
jgi:hypothetical protein